jgi:hypothetical protein
MECIVAVAIIRDHEVISRGFRSHYELRQALNPELHDHSIAKPGDVEGFVTSLGRFVNRRDAKGVAIASGQISDRWKTVERDVLSSDIRW